MNINNIAGPCKTSRGGASRADMKKQKASLEKAQSAETPPEIVEPTATKDGEKAKSLNSSNQIIGSAPLGPHHEPENRRNTAEYGSCVDTGQIFNAAEWYDSATCQEDASEVLGPYEWLDSEIKRLECILQREELSSGSSNAIDTPEKESRVAGVSNWQDERGNAGAIAMGLHRRATNDDQGRESNCVGSSKATSPELYNCYSSRLDGEWHDWNWPADSQWDWRDEEDGMLSYIGVNGNSEGDEDMQLLTEKESS